MKRFYWILAVLLTAAMLLGACAPAAAPTTANAPTEPAKPVKLVVLTHWGEESSLKPMQAKFDEYMKLNPNVTIEYQTVTFDQLLPKITTAKAAGVSPDVLHFYNLWLPDFVKGGGLAEPPQDVVMDIQTNYAKGSVAAVSIGGKPYGYPTEINTYLLVWNKKQFADAGISAPPKTWDELKDIACKLKVTGSDGKVERAGFALMPGWDSGVVHPFLSLLWSGKGQYLSPDNTKTAFNSPEGVSLLKLYNAMISEKCADPAIGSFNDFVTGKASMIIMANWFRATLKDAFVDKYENVGVAPIPTANGATSTTLQYNWLWGVDSGSKNQAEAWKLVKWLNNPASSGAASPMGDYLTSAMGAIPSRTSDQQALADRLGDDFLKAFTASTANSIPEPVVLGGQEVKTSLQTNIEAAWYGKKTPEQALTDAAAEGDKILAEKR